jgi:two-component system LytT family response regulator
MSDRSNIRALIVDDEPLARKMILKFLKAEPSIDVIGEAGTGRQAVELIEKHQPELVFLDIQMPGMNGFEVIQAIRVKRMPQIIFVTAYDRYALRAFDVHALDYLLKPFNRGRFEKAVERAKTLIKKHSQGTGNDKVLVDRLERLVAEMLVRPEYLQRLAVQSKDRVFFVKTELIDRFEAAEKYIRIHTENKTHVLRGSMKSIEQKLDPKKFMRVHRSWIVNIDYIKEIQPWFNGNFMITLSNGIQLSSGRNYRNAVRELCDNVVLP